MCRATDEDDVELVAPGEEDDYLCARPSDHLFCPFECDGCTFHRLKGRRPQKDNRADDSLQIHIRRANLDAFWARRPDTTSGLRRLFFEQVKVGEHFEFEMFEPPGPFRQNCDSGTRSALGVLWQSQKPGRHEEKQKCSSVRKVRSLNTNLHDASVRAAESLVWRSDKSRFVATTAPSDSEWHVKFVAGLHARIGDRRKRDAAISIQQMLALQDLMETEWVDSIEADDLGTQRAVAEIGAFFLTACCASLRGFELPKIVLSELRNQIVLESRHGETPHVGIPLRGRFKARSNAIERLLVFTAAVTASGLKPGIWLDRLVRTLENLGITNGWLFQDDKGIQRPLSYFEDGFHTRLFAIRDADPTLFEAGTDILEDHHLARSLRRGAAARATNAGADESDTNWINRWNTGGSEIASGPMHVICSDQKQTLETFLRFSLALQEHQPDPSLNVKTSITLRASSGWEQCWAPGC